MTKYLILATLLISSIVLADNVTPTGAHVLTGAAPPASMPISAAQDLDYALMKRQQIVNDAIEEFKRELAKRTVKQDKTIKELVEKYKLHLYDEKGQPLDSVDVETGKIRRGAAPAKK
jgi:hypothetical protein